MRILVLNYEYPPLGGGGGVAAANISEEMARLGHSVDYITSHFQGLERQQLVNGVRVFREPVAGRRDYQTASILSMLSFPAAAVRRAVALHREADYDIIHTHFAIPSGPAGYILSKLWRKPHVLSVHGGDIYDPSKKYSPHRHPLLKLAVKRVLDQASAVVAQSKDIADRTVSIYHPKRPPLRIPLGFRTPRFAAVDRAGLGLEDGTVYAIAVSRLVSRKGYPNLLEALAKCRSQNLRLLIAGDGPEAASLCRQCAELGIEDRVHFLGQVTEEQKYQYLSNVDIFCLATYHEGFGIVYQEAMHCGLPIVTTNVGGQTDFLTDGDNALLTDPGDVDGLAAHLDRLAGDEAERKRMGARNRGEIMKYMIDGVARQYLLLFEEQTARRKS